MFILTETITLAHLVIEPMLVDNIIKVYEIEKVSQRWKRTFADVVSIHEVSGRSKRQD